jgi:fructokinase
MAEVTAFKPKPGGAPANVAVAASRLGAMSGFTGKVGEDIFGHYLEGVLASEGVNTSGVRFDPAARTTLVFIALPDANSAEFVFYRNPGADMLLSPEDLDPALISTARYLHFGSLSLIVEPSGSATLAAIEIARNAGALISFDVNYRPTLWESALDPLGRVKSVLPRVDLLKVNETELRILSGTEDLTEGSKALLNLGPRLCVVTLGQKGSFYSTAVGGKFIPAFDIQTIDATGCGDAFIAGLLTRLAKDGKGLDDLSPGRLSAALRFANAVGALTAQTLGVIPALPRTHEVEQFIREREGV